MYTSNSRATSKRSKNKSIGNSMVVQWLQLCAFTAGAQVSPWSGNRDPASCVACPKKKKKGRRRGRRKKKRRGRRKERKLTFTECLLCVGVYTKHYKCLALFNPHNNSRRLVLFIYPVFRTEGGIQRS